MNKNKLTLLIDGNWLLMSRMSVLVKKFDKTNPNPVKQEASNEFETLLAKSLNVIINQFKDIDNIILMADGGSWRKKLLIPQCLQNTTYKGNRTQAIELDWDYIYKPFNKFFKKCESLGITCCRYEDCEGDDWAWYWSRRLNDDGINCIIWTSDNDIKQLIQYNSDSRAFTAWYNSKNGLYLPASINQDYTDSIEFFMRPQFLYNNILENLRHKQSNTHYEDPNKIILDKIFNGDAGDNIKPVVKYSKNNRLYKLTKKEYNAVLNHFNINTIDDLKKSYKEISQYISNLKNIKPHHIDSSDIYDMLLYNTKLVWLHEETIPETLIAAMNQFEYKYYDVDYIRSNYTILLDDDVDVMNIFESIK